MTGAETKAAMPLKRLIIFGIFAGAYIALAGAGSNMAAFNLLSDSETFGIGKILSGAIFTAGAYAEEISFGFIQVIKNLQ